MFDYLKTVYRSMKVADYQYQMAFGPTEGIMRDELVALLSIGLRRD